MLLTAAELKALEGLTVEQARELIEPRGLTLYVQQPGNDANADAVFNRVTVTLDGDKIKSARMLGVTG